MTCSCGAYVPPSVRFCSNCGAPASDPEATRIARLQSRALEYGGDNDLEHHPASRTVRHRPVDVERHRAFAAQVATIAPHER